MTSILEILLGILWWRVLDDGIERGQRSRRGRIAIITFAIAAIAIAGWLLTRKP